jgi:hypothetical protein
MTRRVITILAIALLCSTASVSWADLAPFTADFEDLDQTSPTALGDAGWLVFGNTFYPNGNYWFGYGVFPAPNGTPGFSSVAIGEGGPQQGDQQLVVYSDYNNGFQADGYFVEANVFQEQTIGAADIGTIWRFEFQAKLGDLAGGSVAKAFFKTIDPSNNFALTNFIPIDMTNIPGTWERYSISIYINPTLEGQLLQFGFLSTATLYEPSGVFYDNINFGLQPDPMSIDIRPQGCPNPITSRINGLLPVAVLGTAGFDVSDVDVSSLRLEGVSPFLTGYEDVATPYVGELCGCTDAGPDGFLDLTLKFHAQEIVQLLALSQRGDRRLRLTGTLLDGTPIEGTDCMVVVGGGRPAMDAEFLGGGNLNQFQQVGNGGSGTGAASRGSSARGEVRER